MFYIFHGSDTHSQKETLLKTIAKMGDPGMLELNTTRLSGPLTFNQLQQATAALPFLAKNRIVIVENYLTSKPPQAELDKLLAYLPDLPDFSRLFFLEESSLSAKHRVMKLAEELPNGFVKQFDPPAGRKLEQWVQKQAAARAGRIHPQAAQLLVNKVAGAVAEQRGRGPDHQLAILSQEIEKLVLYRGNAEISAADVQLLSPYAAEIKIFDLVDAIGGRHEKKAAQLLQEKLAEGEEPFLIFAMIIRQFRLMIQVKTLADEGDRASAISKKLRLHSFVAGKLLQQSQGFGMNQLEQIYRHLLEIDLGVKTGKQELVTALHLFVAALTTADS